MSVLAAAQGLADSFTEEGRQWFTSAEAGARLGKTRGHAAKVLRQMREAGLADRIRSGRYVLCEEGRPGIPTWARDPALSIAAGFDGIPHRIAYRSALEEHSMVIRFHRAYHVACSQRVRSPTLSTWPLHVVWESPETIHIGAMLCRGTMVSTRERALLDAADHPEFGEGVDEIAKAMDLFMDEIDAGMLRRLGQELGLHDAVRRLGSIADTLEMPGIAGRLPPPPSSCRLLRMSPNMPGESWVDLRWRVIWARSPERTQNEVEN